MCFCYYLMTLSLQNISPACEHAECGGSDVSALQDVDHAHVRAPDVFVCSVSAEEEEMPLPVQVFNFQVN